MNRKIILLLIISILIPSSENVEFNIQTYDIIKSKSTVRWKGSKSTGSYHDGNILVENGMVNISQNNILNGEIIINMNSITCTDIEDENSNQYLVEHLKNEDFFSVSEFPFASLKIISLEHKEKNNYLIKADLTIKNQTHPVEFIANIQINKEAALATGKINVDRSKYNIKYKSKTWYPDLGDRFINDIFELYFNLVALPKS